MKKLIILFFSLTLTNWSITYDQRDIYESQIEEGLAISEYKDDANCKLYGYWDSRYTPDDAPANVYKGYLDGGRAKELSERGPVIPILSGFGAKDNPAEIEERFQIYKDRIEEIHNIEFIILQDEPYYKGFTKDKLEQIVEIGRRVLGNYRFSYSFARGNIRNLNIELPQNLDIVGINFYPFYEFQYNPLRYYTTESQFMNYLNGTVNIARNKAPASEIFIVGQGFSAKGKYRKPPVESPLWYAKFLQENEDVIGMLWYEWRDTRFKGTKSMPDFYDKQKEAFRELCP